MPTVEPGFVAESLVLPVGLAEQVVPVVVAERNSTEQVASVVVAERNSTEQVASVVVAEHTSVAQVVLVGLIRQASVVVAVASLRHPLEALAPE